LLIAVVVGVAIGTVLAVGMALHSTTRIRPGSAAAEAVARQTGATWSDVQVTASDGARLDGWFFRPRESNGSAVILLHGVGDTRLGMLGHAAFLLRNGFMVLTPDSRGHGASGGELITYGIREASDVHAWADRLFREPQVKRLYGLGESLGAAILLQSLPKEPRFRAVVAESPFATFEEISYDRMKQVLRLPKAAFWPVLHLGILYARVRYGLDMRQASPANAVRSTAIPILLIHGTADTNIPIRHSQELHALNPTATRLWEVQGAEHVAGLLQDPELYTKTVVSWFVSHSEP
jgi:dipeptidyl aminopeptidase/acylaminoacyl peptidase